MLLPTHNLHGAAFPESCTLPKLSFMKKIFSFTFLALIAVITSCNPSMETKESGAENTVEKGQSAVQDDESAKDVVKVASGSKDHSTLVAAVKQAELVDALSNAGPFTIFAPTNAAFDLLPKGTVENLMKPENKAKLQDILQYHVYVGNLKTDLMQDGQTLNQVNGGNILITKKNGQVILNNSAKVVSTIPASNGIIHVIDGVLIPTNK